MNHRRSLGLVLVVVVWGTAVGCKHSTGFKPPATANPPVKVGGGAMSITTSQSGNNGWYTADGKTYCTTVKSIKIDFRGEDDNSKPVTGPTSTQWMLKFYGRTPDGSASSGRGLQVTSSAGSCNGNSGPSLLVTTFDDNSGTSPGGFYLHDPWPDPASGDAQMLRFWDQTKDCTQPHDSTPPGKIDLDEDKCERVFQMLVCAANGTNCTPAGGGASDSKACRQGDCGVFIGN